MSQLPDKLSALIRVALADLRKIEADPAYVVDMSAWHRPRGETCTVCLAGSVMAKSLRVAIGEWSHPSKFDLETQYRLEALNCARGGRVHDALIAMEIAEGRLGTMAPEWAAEIAPTYRTMVPEPFHAYMEDLANRLEEKGL